MTDTTAASPVPQTDAELSQAIDQCLAQIEAMRRQMAQDQIEIDRLKAKTRATLKQLRAA